MVEVAETECKCGKKFKKDGRNKTLDTDNEYIAHLEAVLKKHHLNHGFKCRRRTAAVSAK